MNSENQNGVSTTTTGSTSSPDDPEMFSRAIIIGGASAGVFVLLLMVMVIIAISAIIVRSRHHSNASQVKDDDEQGEPEANTTVIINDQAQEYVSHLALGFKNKMSSESNVADDQDHEYEVVEIRKQVKDDVILDKCAAYAHPRSEDEGAYDKN